MKVSKAVKWARVAVSLLFLVFLTIVITGIPALNEAVARWGTETQITPAILTFSLGSIIFWVIATLIFGRIYCSTVCPLGTLEDIFARLHLRRRYRFMQPRNVGALLIVIFLIITTYMGYTIFLTLLDPYHAYANILDGALHPSLSTIIIGSVTLLVTAFLAWKWGRIFCNTICPVGTLLAIISRTTIFHIEIDPDTCIRCRRCVDVCKASCIDIDTTTVDFSRCVMCINCLNACNDDAISYRLDRKQLMTPMFQRIQNRRKAPTVACTGNDYTTKQASRINEKQSQKDETVS